MDAATLKRIERLTLATRRRVDAQLAGEYRSAFRGQGMEFEEVRRYTPGDDVRAIDWNVTARSSDPYIKLFREERELVVWVVADGSGSMRFGTRSPAKAELAAHAAAVFTFTAIGSRDRVGLVTFGSGAGVQAVPPRRGRRHGMRVIRDVVADQAAAAPGGPAAGRGGSGGLAEALRRVSASAVHRSVVVVIGDFLDSGPGERAALKRLLSKHDVVPVVVADAAESALVDVGLLEVVDAETGRRGWLDTSSRRVRRRYAEAAAEAEARRVALFRGLRLTPLRLETGADPMPVIERYLRRREGAAR